MLVICYRLTFSTLSNYSDGHFDVWFDKPADSDFAIISPSNNSQIICSVNRKKNCKKRSKFTNATRKIKLKTAKKKIHLKNCSKIWKIKYRSGLEYDPQIKYDDNHIVNIGKMNHVCKHCHAFKWKVNQVEFVAVVEKYSLRH